MTPPSPYPNHLPSYRYLTLYSSVFYYFEWSTERRLNLTVRHQESDILIGYRAGIVSYKILGIHFIFKQFEVHLIEGVQLPDLVL